MSTQMRDVNRRHGCWAYTTYVRRPASEETEPRYAITDRTLCRTYLGRSWASAYARWQQARGAAFGTWTQERGLA